MAKKTHPLHLYGTLGPACCSEETLVRLLQAGMTGVRLNLSHRPLPSCRDWLLQLYRACEHCHIVPDLLVDLQGPELRIGDLKEPLPLTADSSVLLGESPLPRSDSKDTAFSLPESNSEDAASPVIPVPGVLFPHLEEGMTLKLDDGKIFLKVEERAGEHFLRAKVVYGGLLQSKKSIAAEGLKVKLPVLTAQDLDTLQELRKYRVTGVMLPFVRSEDDLISLKKELLAADMAHIKIFAKLETEEGARNLPALLPHCDEVVIARGDLGNAVPLPTLPGWQKRISFICREAGVPFMVVTQMLASMEHSPVPTRAEVNDIFTAVIDGASSLMLTGETAAGQYPVEAMQMLSDTATEARKFLKEDIFFSSIRKRHLR